MSLKQHDAEIAQRMLTLRNDLLERRKILEAELKIEKERYNDAAKDADRSENTPLTVARENIAKINISLAEIARQLNSFDSISSDITRAGKIIIGSTVRLQNLDLNRNFIIKIYPTGLGNASLGGVSASSTLGVAIMGKSAGDFVSIQVRAGLHTYLIQEVY